MKITDVGMVLLFLIVLGCVLESKVLDEFWTLYFMVSKGIFLALATLLNIIAMSLLAATQRFVYVTSLGRQSIEGWQPVRPAIFGEPHGRKSEGAL